MRGSIRNFRLALETLIVVAIIVGLRALIFALGFPGLSPTALVSSIIGGGIFVMGLVIAGTLSDYKDAERAPTDLAAGLYAILRETESMNRVWGKPDMHRMRARLIEVVDGLRRDIDAGNTRDCQTAVKTSRIPSSSWRSPTSRRTMSFVYGRSRPGFERPPCGSITSSVRSSSPRPTP